MPTDVSVRKNVVPVKGKDGVVRDIDMGGLLRAEHGGKIYLLFTHDECCFKSGDLRPNCVNRRLNRRLIRVTLRRRT